MPRRRGTGATHSKHFRGRVRSKKHLPVTASPEFEKRIREQFPDLPESRLLELVGTLWITRRRIKATQHWLDK